MKRALVYIILIVAVLYVGFCVYLYLYQDKLIFHPIKLDPNFEFNFSNDFQELWFKTNDGEKINALHFKNKDSKGLIFYLHGSGGNINRYESNIPLYLNLGYDFFMLDYRGYGKSTGSISSELQFYNDIEMVFEKVQLDYQNKKIIVIGFSLGTIPSARLASMYDIDALILQGSPVSIIEKGKEQYPYVHHSLIARYSLSVQEFLPNVKCPVYTFYGELDADNINRMKPNLKLTDHFKILKGEDHTDFVHNRVYFNQLEQLINE